MDEWFTRSRTGRQSVEHDSRPENSSSSTDHTHVHKIKDVVHANCHLTVTKLAKKVRISIGSYHDILTEQFKMSRVTAKFVLRLMTQQQKENRVDTHSDLSPVLYQKSDDYCPPAPLLPRPTSLRLFLILEIEINTERTLF